MGDGLPSFQGPKRYFLKGATLNKMLQHLRENRPCGTVKGGVNVDAITFDGTFLSPDIGAGGGGGEDDDLPKKYDESKCYALKRATYNLFSYMAAINQTKATEHDEDQDYLQVSSQGEAGTILSYFPGS